MKPSKTYQKLLLSAIFVATILLFGCKKEKDGADDTIKQTQQINLVLPQKYIDTLKNLGISIHEGTTPPIVNGIYIFSPSILKASNIPGDEIGSTFSESKIKMENQNNTDFTLCIIGQSLLVDRDTSIVTAISGSGNNFTVYSKIKATAGSNYAYFAVVFSGTMSDSGIKNLEYGIINIDNSHGVGTFISEGSARLVYDGDFITVTSPVFRVSTTPISNNTKIVGLI